MTLHIFAVELVSEVATNVTDTQYLAKVDRVHTSEQWRIYDGGVWD